MKRKLGVIVLIIATLLLAGCGKTARMKQRGADGVQRARDQIEELKNSTAEIVKFGTCSSEAINNGDVKIELISWDLGYSGNSLKKGAENMCLKFHITNNGSEQIVIDDYVNAKIFLDGVETTHYISDFYGNNVSYKIDWSSALRGNSETDFYICIDCTVDDFHKVEVDMCQSGEVLGTFSFETE